MKTQPIYTGGSRYRTTGHSSRNISAGAWPQYRRRHRRSSSGPQPLPELHLHRHGLVLSEAEIAADLFYGRD